MYILSVLVETTESLKYFKEIYIYIMKEIFPFIIYGDVGYDIIINIHKIIFANIKRFYMLYSTNYLSLCPLQESTKKILFFLRKLICYI